MRAIPVETINKIIGNIKSDLAIDLLKAIINTHAVEVSSTQQHPNFVRLVTRISTIDPKAADWIIENQDIRNLNKEASELDKLMNWCFTPQGQDYWREISNKLGE